MDDIREVLVSGLTKDQASVVRSDRRRVLVIAGAGSGKTEVMARRVAWWVGVENVPKDHIVAFTFTERAAEEMKFRIRQYLQKLTRDGDDTTLGGMYIGTIHGFCLKSLREMRPDDYHNFDVMDETARLALVQRGYHGILGLRRLEQALQKGQFATIDTFLQAYDLLHEFDQFNVRLPSETAPHAIKEEREWCKQAVLLTDVGEGDVPEAFAEVAARYYAYLRCRRFLDFSTSQSELLRLLRAHPELLKALRERLTHVVVDEVQDINPVQDALIRLMVGNTGRLTAVGDHRQAIFAWRGGQVDIMAKLYQELQKDKKGQVTELGENFRSTGRVIDLANTWARTIGAVRSMSNPAMIHGNRQRTDKHVTHVAVQDFTTREQEANWIASAIRHLVPAENKGAAHDTRAGDIRGISYADVAVLIRSSADARTYMNALQRVGVPAIFRAGPDLFSQPEVLLFVATMARMAGLDQFVGPDFDQRSLPNRVNQVLNCPPTPDEVIRNACAALRSEGLPLAVDVEDRLLLATDLVQQRIAGTESVSSAKTRRLHTEKLVKWLEKPGKVRRIFPQTLFQYMLAETGVGEWEACRDRGSSAMFHLGTLSSLVKGMETPGWTDAGEFRYQVIALCLWGTQNARTEEAPLLVPPNAVTISTIHAAKGLEYAAVFLADVNARRFPSQRAKTQITLPFEGDILTSVNPALLADNDNLDGERRLMYVALTRAERYLFISCSGTQRSRFFRELSAQVAAAGGVTGVASGKVPDAITYAQSELKRELRLVTSFSDLRYYLECPHDFYLRKVLGFAPTIDQAFGYGRGVHNLLRAVHSDPAAWAKLAKNPAKLKERLTQLVDQGLFYLRYTTGNPADNMRARALDIVSEYIQAYAGELSRLSFEPEREFETLIEEEQVLISGAIDVVRLDNPPRVTLIDFKSGEQESDISTKLDEDEMRLQVSLYGLAAKQELEYEPERGLVRYLGEADRTRAELAVDLTAEALSDARQLIVETAKAIRERNFHSGPRKKPRDKTQPIRCAECDFGEFCGMPEAAKFRKARAKRYLTRPTGD